MDLFKIKGQLGEVTEELDAMDEKGLHNVVVQAESAMKTAKEELEANKDYQQAKQDVKDLSAGKRDLDKYQKAKIQYSLHRLEELGTMSVGDRALFNIESLKKLAAIEQSKAKQAAAAAEKEESESE